MHLDPPRHLVHFDKRTLSKTFQKAGLIPEGVSYISFEHDPYGWTESAINRITGRKNILTRYLMGFDRPGIYTLFAFSLFCLLFLPALIISILSWIFKRGALIEMSGRIAEAEELPTTGNPIY